MRNFIIAGFIGMVVGGCIGVTASILKSHPKDTHKEKFDNCVTNFQAPTSRAIIYDDAVVFIGADGTKIVCKNIEVKK